MTKTDKDITMLAVGDVVLGIPNSNSLFDLVRPTLKSADLLVGQLEILFTSRPVNTYMDIPMPPCDPANIGALTDAGFHVLTLASNHNWDAGVPGIEDTVSALKKLDISYCGAGMDLEEARKPCVVQRHGTRIGFLNYNCVGPKMTWATPGKPGCAYIRIINYAEAALDGPPTVYTFPDPLTVQAMADDIRKLRQTCDVLVVALHKGMGHTPVKLAMYEQPLSYAAIDAGADLVLSHHAHILRGIEFYRGKAIFHGLCNFAVATPAMTVDSPVWAIREWARKRQEMMNFKVDPEYPYYAFHPEAKQSIVAKITIENKNISRISYLPCFIHKNSQPEILKNNEMGQRVFEYMERITRESNLNAHYKWDGDEVLVF
jgi:poly-gamma-glutamate capsule biosynthesis protein CapA/YwtB (metallophosphatase superfamily)